MTYCGKTCEECPKHLEAACVGCRNGLYSRDCEIAKCCREKGHEFCGSCTYVLSCRTRNDRDLMPEKLLDRQRREEELRIERMAKAQLLGKWLWPIFWVMIAQNVISLLDLEWITNKFPVVGHISVIATAALSVYVGWCYLQLKDVDDRYQFVGLVTMGTSLYSVATHFLPEDNWLMILLAIPVIIVGFMSEYRKCMAHSDALVGISDEHAEKWQKQWKLYRNSLIGLGVSLVLLIVPLANILAALALLVFACMFLFVVIREYVYLYQTADLFRACPGEE